MAAGTKLVCTFETNNGGTTSFTFNYAKVNATLANVKTLLSAITTNGAIFSNAPVTAKSAKIVTTTETEYDLSA